jgi:hypothetical protein
MGREVPETSRIDMRELIAGYDRVIYRMESNRISTHTIENKKQQVNNFDIYMSQQTNVL